MTQTLNTASLLAEYDQAMRRDCVVAGCVGEATQHSSRYTTLSGSLRFILWYQCTADEIAALVQREIDDASGQARALMWKIYAHDSQSAPLHNSLLTQGFAEQDPCTLMLAPVQQVIDSLAATTATTAALSVRQLHAETDLDAYQTIWDSVWPDAPNARYVNDYRRLLRERVPGVVFFAGFADGIEPVSSGYMFHQPDTRFALLCGGATREPWRRQHAYSLMLAARARCARERGATYLSVEASAQSKPVLERLGFVPLSTVMFYEKVLTG